MLWLQRARTGAVIACALMIPAPAHTERPPLRSYTAADGLAHDRVSSILADSRGFLWFGTADGFSRFDGSHFTTYDASDGLSEHSVNTMVEIGRDGYLVGTNGGGVGWYRPHIATTAAAGIRMFLVDERLAAANRVNILFRDSRGGVWAGTDGGLFELVREGDTLTFVRVDIGSDDEARVQVWALAEDALSRLWIGTSSGLRRLTRDGAIAHDAVHPAQGADHVRALVVDSAQRVWAGHGAGLFLIGEASHFPPFDRPRTRGKLGDRIRLTVADGLPNNRIHALHLTSDGTIWIGTDLGLSALRGTQFSAAGFSTLRVRTLAVDHRGDLWIGTIASGVIRLSTGGLTTFGPEDGLAHSDIRNVFETHDGRLAVVTSARALSIFDGTRFDTIRPKLPDRVTTLGRGRHVLFLEDSRGDWWVPSGDGLFRFTGIRRAEDLAHRAPSHFYTARDGLAGGDIWRLFEDSRGDLWIATRVPGREVLTRWDRTTGRFHRYGEADGLPPYNAVAAFAEDGAGQIWVGFWDGGAARLRSGRFEVLPNVRHPIVGWHVDRTGKLWGASLGSGLIRVNHPDLRDPQIEEFGKPEGLPTERMTAAIVDDDLGRLYAGSVLGVTRLDPTTGNIRHYTVEDGLARNELTAAFRDRTGALWFGTNAGLSRLVPQDGERAGVTQVLIRGARINGTALPLPDLGTAAAGPFEFGDDQRTLEIDYVSLGMGHTSGLEHRLEGAEREWTRAAGNQTVNYALLPSGSYRFVVRGRGSDGWVDASLTFAIQPPVWQRAWFVVSMAGLIAGGLLMAHRLRVARLLAVERVRTRIASDLHDDIGSNLSQIAILGELSRRGTGAGGAVTSLTRIADLSRESVDALSDIVWSIDPNKDHLNNLTMRMRRLASDLLGSRDLPFTFEVHGVPDLTIGADVRREVFLAFKETLHNVVRHADSRNVAIEVRLQGGQLGFRIRDDGRGFDTANVSGHGLSSLRLRAERLGGSLSIVSQPGVGTTVELTVPNRSRGGKGL